jgi:hypothetical protein
MYVKVIVMRACLSYLGIALLTFVAVGLNSAAGPGPSPRTNQEADNDTIVWGGGHIRLHLTKAGGALEFDCANGTLAKPLTVDSQGKFRVSGTYTRETPGPTMRDGYPSANATYSGSIVGGTMRLHVVAGTDKEVVGDFELIRGESGHVMKCK